MWVREAAVSVMQYYPAAALEAEAELTCRWVSGEWLFDRVDSIWAAEVGELPHCSHMKADEVVV